MLSNSRLVSMVFALSLLLGISTSASAAATAKSWEVDLYDDETAVTYVDDGYDDIDVYDHRYDNRDYGYEYRRPRVTFHYERGHRYDYGYSRHHGRSQRNRYYDGYRRW